MRSFASVLKKRDALLKSLRRAQTATAGTPLRIKVWLLMKDISGRFPGVRQAIARRSGPEAAQILDDLRRADVEAAGVEKQALGDLLKLLEVR